MKLTFITNACAIYEADGFRLLSDPWLTEPAFGSWVHDPPITTKPQDVVGVDALYISHIHADHCDPETLKHFRRDIPIVCLADRFTPKHLERMGFTDVNALDDSSPVGLGPFDLTMFGPFVKHPHHDCEIGNVIDSALLIECGSKRVLNTNDNMPTALAGQRLLTDHGPFDVVQLNYNNAGPYPACFTGIDRKAEAKKCVERNLRHLAKVAKALDARYTMPFAGAYKLGHGKEHLNEFLGTCSAEEACLYLEGQGVKSLMLREGESFEL